MNKLYEVIEPTVIDDEIIRTKAIQYSPGTSSSSNISDIAGLHSLKKEAVKKEVFHLEFHEVTHLQFSFLNILKIENLVGFQRLTKLQLDNNIIERIEGLSHLVTLEWLDLSFNNIKKIEGLETLTRLTDLSLFSNQISQIEGLDNLTNLEALSLGKNNIKELHQVVYLRKFPKLAILNLSQTHVSKLPEYRSYVLAYVNNLKYLDYRLVEDQQLNMAREQYQDEILRIKEEELVSKNALSSEKSNQDRLAILRAANLTTLDSLYDDLIRESGDLPILSNLPLVQDNLQEYKERCKGYTEDYEKAMTTLYHSRNREVEQFQKACRSAEKTNEAQGKDLIQKFNKQFKQFIRTQNENKKKGIKEIDGAEAVDDLRLLNSKLSDDLLELEVQLVEQLEEFIKEYERRLSDLAGSALEAIQSFFGKLRDLETAFHERLMNISNQEVERLNKGEMEIEVPERLRDLLQDRETLTNMINASHDAQSLLIEGKEDELTKYESRTLEDMIAKVKRTETQRNRERVSEIWLMISYNANQISNPD